MPPRYESLFDMHGKVVLVAGGGGAIGSEMARAVAAFGAKVAVCGRTARRCDQVAAGLAALGSEAMGLVVDVVDEPSVARAVAGVEARLGPVDVLINAVGAHIEQPAQELTLEAWDTVLGVNLRGAFVLSQAVGRSMIARGRGGSHIHVTSVRSDLGINRGYAAYCAGKGGLRVLIKPPRSGRSTASA